VPRRRRRLGRRRDQAPRRDRRRRAAHPLPRAAQPRPAARRPVRGIFAAQEIKPQARVLATDRGIACAVVDYDALRGLDDPSHRLF
jgi:RecB family endonuclease NucS